MTVKRALVRISKRGGKDGMPCIFEEWGDLVLYLTIVVAAADKNVVCHT